MLAFLQAETIAMTPHGWFVAQNAVPNQAVDHVADLASLGRKAGLMRDICATQMSVTDDVPIATYENHLHDPYPAWFVHCPSLLKIFLSAELKPLASIAYLARIQHIRARRCAVLERDGLERLWNRNLASRIARAVLNRISRIGRTAHRSVQSLAESLLLAQRLPSRR
ncbi:hypothetical protein [Sphingomonas sp. UYEF23]|uniref:hypothetical protein n=1 Tax=Sphingomonas sp. UYEF23 TaxID=1756408 RepID=UPI0033964B0B